MVEQRLVTKTDVFIRFRWSSVDSGKRCENANVDTFILLCVFKKQKTEVFENALVCTGLQFRARVRFFPLVCCCLLIPSVLT